MNNCLNLIYRFRVRLSDIEMNEVIHEVEECGGINKSIDQEYLQLDFSNDKTRLLFVDKFKRTKSYEKTFEYKEEQKELGFMFAVNHKYMRWIESTLETILNSSGGDWRRRGSQLDWELLITLLNEGWIEVKGETYPDIPAPPIKSEEYNGHFACYHMRGGEEMKYIGWCAWNWLRAKGEKKPEFPQSKANLYSPKLNTYIKIGDGDPHQIIFHILSDMTATYIHMPYDTNNVMFIFKPTELFTQWLENSEQLYSRSRNTDDSIEYDEAFNQVLSQFIINLEGIKEQRDNINRYLKKIRYKKQKELEHEELIKNSQLDLYDDDKLFSLKEVTDILNYDKQYGTSERKSVDDLGGLIRRGTIKGEKINKRWHISKKELIKYLISLKKKTEWNEEKRNFLINEVIAGTENGELLTTILQQVSEKMGIPSSKCKYYWHKHVDKKTKDIVKDIKKRKEENWTIEETLLLEKIITEDHSDIPVVGAYKIASKILKRHTDDIRKKWLSLQKEKTNLNK